MKVKIREFLEPTKQRPREQTSLGLLRLPGGNLQCVGGHRRPSDGDSHALHRGLQQGESSTSRTVAATPVTRTHQASADASSACRLANMAQPIIRATPTRTVWPHGRGLLVSLPALSPAIVRRIAVEHLVKDALRGAMWPGLGRDRASY